MQIAVFGSAARGTSDASSDFDVIAVINNLNEVDKRDLQKTLNELLRKNVGLSMYSEKRLRALWDQGSPFAWHLYLEARPVLGYQSSFLCNWGVPSPYRTAEADCEMMASILQSANERLVSKLPYCECYEAGLLYVGARNIGMFASNGLMGQFNFSRTAPLMLRRIIQFPLTESEFSRLVKARHATTRGAVPPELNREWLRRTSRDLIDWAMRVKGLIGNGGACGI